MQTPQVVPVQRFFHVPKFQPPTFQKPTHVGSTFPAPRQHAQPTQSIEFDGKRLRKAVTRKTVDYNSSVVKYLEARVWQRDYRDRRVMQPDPAYYTEMTPPLAMPDNPINAVTTKFVRTSTNKMRCPIFCVAWTPEGRRLVTGASSGEFTLWNGLTFNFETILQAHDSSVRCMVWSHNDVWMVTGDHAGYVKYWQSNMNNVKMFQAHKEPLRGISFCPVDTKFVTCSDDGTVRIYDFLKCFEEKILRGHGSDVKCVDWHPQKSLIVSGSKDSQQPIKLWDPKSGQSLATIHAHKNTVMDAKWNKNGNWLLTASRDHLIKIFDIRNMNQEMQTFRGHKKEATTLAWHPIHENLFTSGGSDGCVMFWVVGADKEVGCMEQAHDSCVWSLAWHPLGHILCSGSNDHSSKFWTRNRPGDRMRDKYNLNTLPKGQEDAADYDDTSTISAIPGMGLEYGLPEHLKAQENSYDNEVMAIPGLDFTSEETTPEKNTQQKKIPFSKPIPKQFQQQWMESKQPLLLAPPLEQQHSNGEVPMNINTEVNPPPLPPPSLMMSSEQQQHFQPNSRGGNQYPDQHSRQSQRSHHGQRPMDQNQAPSMSNPDMHLGNMPPGDRQYSENESFPADHHRNEERPHETWRTYGDQPSNMDAPPNNEMHPENGSFHHNPDHQHGFEPHNNVGPPNRGRPERFPQNHRRGENENPNHRRGENENPNHRRGENENPNHRRGENENPNHRRGEEEFMSENMPPRGGPLPYEDNMFQSGDMDSRNNHMGPGSEEMGFAPHKRSWNDGPGREDQYQHDFDGSSNFASQPNVRQQTYHGRPRGHRMPYRGRQSPYRVINRGRGSRGGYN